MKWVVRSIRFGLHRFYLCNFKSIRGSSFVALLLPLQLRMMTGRRRCLDLEGCTLTTIATRVAWITNVLDADTVALLLPLQLFVSSDDAIAPISMLHYYYHCNYISNTFILFQVFCNSVPLLYGFTVYLQPRLAWLEASTASQPTVLQLRTGSAGRPPYNPHRLDALRASGSTMYAHQAYKFYDLYQLQQVRKLYKL